MILKMQRYLIRFSYFGTNFRGLQVQNRTKNDYETIQGVLESGLRYLQPANEPVAHSSSRTDAGVHAFDNCLHVDLLAKCTRSPYPPSYITHHLNDFLRKAGVDIRVKSTQAVSPAFNARHCVNKRHYLYRIAVSKEHPSSLCVDNDRCYHNENYCPLPELNRVFIMWNPVDMTKLKEGCTLLQRNADFASFMASPSKNTKPPESTIKNLEVSLSPGQPLMDPLLDSVYSRLDFYNITFSSHSFLHNQIRRCMAVLSALAQDVMTTDQVENMFEDPRPGNVPGGVNLAPAYGLYLLKVDYPDHTLHPDYIGKQSERFIDVRTRVKTMVALGQSNFQRENRVVDKLCGNLRMLEELRDSILKENVEAERKNEHQTVVKEQQSLIETKILGTEENSVVNEHETDSNSKAEKPIQSFIETEDFSNGLNEKEVETNLLGNGEHEAKTKTPRSIDHMSGHEKRRILDKLYSLLKTRDKNDEEISVLMDKLIQRNPMNKHCYDEEAMERTILEIIKSRRISREVKIRIARMKKHLAPCIDEPITKDDKSHEEDEVHTTVQICEK